jgi:small subunit ribosomal protein S13
MRALGVELPNKKHLRIALRVIDGIGKTRADEVCAKLSVDPQTKVEELPDSFSAKLQAVLSEYRLEGDLRREISKSIKNKIDIGCYSGMRHKRGLPVRGQRTRTNARTRKGKRKSG